MTNFSNPFKDVGASQSTINSLSKVKFSFSPHPKRAKVSPMTVQQYIAMQDAKKSKHSGSFFDEIKHAGSSGLHAVGWTFDKLLRPEYALATAVDRGIGKHGSFGAALHGAKLGFEGKSKEGFGEVLAHHGVLKGHGTLRGVAGFGLDVLADPLTYVSGGASNVVLHSAEHAAAFKAGEVALSDAKDLEQLTKARDVLSGAGDTYKYRHALANEKVSQLSGAADEAAGQATGRLSILGEAANAERNASEKFLPQFKIGVGKKSVPITPTAIGGQRVVPALPKLDNFIAKGGAAGSVAGKYRDLFMRSAHETPETHAALITHRHVAEQLASENLKIVRDHFRDVNISEQKALEALHLGETTKGFILKTKNGKYRINEGAISNLQRGGKLDATQVHFLRRWHQATELLYHRDHSLGVNYEHLGERGQLYVPHLVDKSGHPLSDVQANKLTKATFQHNRTGTLSVLQLDQLNKAGKLGRGVETNPFQLLAHTARNRATKQADATMLQAFSRNLGIKTRIVDTAKLTKNHDAQAQLAAEMGVHQAAHDQAMSDVFTKEQMFLASHEFDHSEKMDSLAVQIRSHKFRRNTPTKAATLARLTKRHGELQAQHVKEVEQLAKGRHKPLNDMLASDLETAGQHNEALKGLQKQQKQLAEVERRIGVGKKNRGEYSAVVHKTVAGAVDEHGHPLAFEPEAAHAIEKYQKIVSGDDKAIEDFSKGWRKWLANWKLAVTSVNPGYRIRNTMSDVWAMYLSGMPMHQVVHYGGKASRLMGRARAGDPEALKFITEAYHHGILSGLYQGDVQAIAKMVQYHGTYKSLAKDKKFIKLSTKVMQDMNAHIENLGRLTHYMYRKEALGESTVKAASTVKKAHFDYEDLTPFEQKVMKGVAPFYTWTRKNIPFQIKSLASKPGRYATFPKAMQESEYASGGDKGNILPNYVPLQLGFQIPWGKHNYYMPQIGAADLTTLDSKGGAVNRLSGLLNPALRTPFELMSNKNLFTGQQIAPDNHPRVPVSGLGASLLSLIPGTNVGKTSRTEGKKVISGPGANPYAAYLLGQIPGTRELGLNLSGINRDKTPIPPELSYFGGQAVIHVDPAQARQGAQIQLQNKVKKQVAGLRDEGRVPRSKKHKPSHNQALINRAIAFNEGRR